MAVIQIPEGPSLGIPDGVKQSRRVDFRAIEFDLAIETKGYLLIWERSMDCPCTPVSIQTENPDPNCPLCKGKGWIYFGASNEQVLTQYTLDELQRTMLVNSGGMIIRGLITTVTSSQEPYEVTGKWAKGSANLTVRSQNRLGYYDRITSLDSQIAYYEVIVADGSSTLPTRYPVIGVNNIRSVSSVYRSGSEFAIENGVITWYPGFAPIANTRISVHYLCHPVWLIVEHPHSVRVTSNRFKKETPTTPAGEALQLPIQALMRYDFLPDPG
jgi:hypothetical protein